MAEALVNWWAAVKKLLVHVFLLLAALVGLLSNLSSLKFSNILNRDENQPSGLAEGILLKRRQKLSLDMIFTLDPFLLAVLLD